MNSVVSAASLASAAALAAPSNLSSVPAQSHPDEKLLSFVSRLKSLRMHLKKADDATDKARARVKAAESQLPPLPPEPEPPAEYADLWHHITNAAMRELSEKHPLVVWERETSDARAAIYRMKRDRQAELNERHGVHVAEDQFDEIWDEMQEVGQSVYDTPAHTLDGLRSKVLALKLLAWADDVDDDWWQSIQRDILTVSSVGSPSIIQSDDHA